MYLGVSLAFWLWGSGCFEILGGESDACSGTALHNSASLRKHCAKTSEIFQVPTSISKLLWWSHQTLGEIAAIDECGSILLWNALELASFVGGAIAGADTTGGTCCVDKTVWHESGKIETSVPPLQPQSSPTQLVQLLVQEQADSPPKVKMWKVNPMFWICMLLEQRTEFWIINCYHLSSTR